MTFISFFVFNKTVNYSSLGRMSAVSKSIHQDTQVEAAVDPSPQEAEMAARYRETMTISSTASLALNFNAVVLVCVFTMCYALFS